jgi:hypothetical protein
VEILEKEQKLMWMPYNEIRDVAALLYVPQWSEANWLLMQMETQLISNTAHTDMTLLRAIAKEFPEKVDYFPILDNDRVLDNKELKVEFRKKIRAQNRFGANVFDSAAVGMWLFGEDPRNNYGLSRVKSNKTAETSESYVLPHNTNFELDENNCVIFRSSKREKTKLLCIHVHSKDPELFSNEAETIKKYLKRNDKHRGEYYLFFPKVFFELVKGNYTGGTLLKFIAFSPIFIKFTEKIRSRLAKYV